MSIFRASAEKEADFQPRVPLALGADEVSAAEKLPRANHVQLLGPGQGAKRAQSGRSRSQDGPHQVN